MNQSPSKEFIILPSSNTSRNYSHCSSRLNSRLSQQMPQNQFNMQYPFQPKDSNSLDMNGLEMESSDPHKMVSCSHQGKYSNNQKSIKLLERGRITSPMYKQQSKDARTEQLIKKFIDKLKIGSKPFAESNCVNQLLQTGSNEVFPEKFKERTKFNSIKNSITIPIPRSSKFREIWKIIMQVTYITTLIFSPLILIYPKNSESIILLFSQLILTALNNLFNLHTSYYQNDVEITNLRQIQHNYIRRYLIKDVLAYLSFIFILQFCMTHLYITIIAVIVLNIVTIQKVKLHSLLSKQLAVLLAYRFSIAICYCHLFAIIQMSMNHSNIVNESISNQFKIYLIYLHKYLDEYLTIYGSLSQETNFELQFAIFVQIVQTCNRIGAILEILFYFYQNIDTYLLKKHYFDFKAFLNHHKIDSQLKKKALSNYKFEMKSDQLQQSSAIDTKSIQFINSEIYKKIDKTINAKYFQKIAVFQKFSQDTQERLIEKMTYQIFQPNEMILKQNSRDDDSLYMIKRGCVKICYTGINNAQTGIKQLTKFQTFGEVSFFTGLPRTSSVICLGPVETYKITRNDFLNVIKNNRSDFEIAQFLKDQVTFENLYDQIGLRCFCCNSPNHLLFSCDKLHYHPNKEKVLSQCSYNHNQIRRYYQRRVKRTQNSRDFLFQIGMAGQEFQENNCNVDSQILRDLTNNQNYLSSTYIQQNQSQKQVSHMPVVYRTRPSNSILLNSDLDDVKESCFEIETNKIRKDSPIYGQQNQFQTKGVVKELEREDLDSISIINQNICQGQTIQQIQGQSIQQIQTNKLNIGENPDRLNDLYIFDLQMLTQQNSPRNCRQNKKSFSYATQPEVSKMLENFKGSYRSNLLLDETDKNRIEQQQKQQRSRSQQTNNGKQDENILIALANQQNFNNFFSFQEDEEFDKAHNFCYYYPFFNPDFVIKKYNNLKQWQQLLPNKSRYTISYVLSDRIKEKVSYK
ncbi:unnamed protein product (macronuclear) [Paramecium tetraurelia]|uniref:Cyclic nucleotide-binding domain-containing protein n=1 Tax=Paramecium tetraurelia TaxID=5888 RepID=A0BGA2_PARTE|nr:uncharacterized protein GSPATT00028604001 [Paramecium tetraurelia]CAK57569.1 unnamed protein product [Paramecium tetraurelia]|eukprot:XP_001424967.1 hypothetical protein (macronuclear) [Paramecium tetraurelia strain d4-2]